MAAPSKSRTEIPDSKIDADSPVTEELKTFERDNSIHNDERIGIPTETAARQANHRHRGLGVDGSDLIELTPQENLIAGGDNPENFTSGDSTTTADKIVFETNPAGKDYKIQRIPASVSRGQSLTKAFVSANIIKKIKSSGGLGRFTCSMHMKRLSSANGVVGGTLRFGLWDGSAFVTDAYVDIAFDTDLTNEYKRFYFITEQIARPTALNLKAQWIADPSNWDTVSAGDIVGHHGGYMVNNGAGLAKWDISHRDGSADDYDAAADDLFYWWDEVITLEQKKP